MELMETKRKLNKIPWQCIIT